MTEFWKTPCLKDLLLLLRPSRGPFLESPGNFSDPKSNIQIEIQRIRAQVLNSKLLQFVSLTDSFIMLHANYWNLDLKGKRGQLTGPVNYRDFRETGPRPQFFERHKTLSSGYISIHWIAQLVSLILIHWTVIYPVDSVTHLLNNWGQNN